MNRSFSIAAMLLLAALLPAHAQQTLYWDANGTAPGSSNAGIGDGAWDTTTPNWNPVADGTGTPVAYAEGDHVVFAAGNDLGSDPTVGGLFFTAAGTHNPGSVVFEEGWVDLTGATLAMGSNPITIKQGAVMSFPNQSNVTATAGQVVTFDGGTMRNYLQGVGSTFYVAGIATRFELTNKGGTVNTPNGGTTAGKTADSINGGYSIMQYGSVAGPSIIACAPGTVSCTLTKTGHGEFRASKDWSMTAVDVKEGLYRISNSTTNGGETGFGAANGTVTVAGGAVANTTNGAALGTTARLTTDNSPLPTTGVGPSPATRSFILSGVGDTPDSMFVLNDSWQILGSISGPGGLMLNGWARNDAGGVPNIIGIQTINDTNGNPLAPVELRLAGNNTYGGKTTINFATIVAQNGSAIPNSSRVEFSTRSDWGVDAAPAANHRTFNEAHLRVDASETIGSLAGGNATRGAVNINGAAVTLTTGADNSSSTFSGTITGAGSLEKVGTGTFTMAGTKSYTGDTKINAGTLSTNSASLADLADVYLTTGGIFNLNFAGSDTIDSLFFNGNAQSIGTWGAPGSGAANTSAFFTGTGILNVTTAPSAGVPGDYNNSGTVDAADYVVWRNAAPNATLPNDPSPGTVDASDYTTWKANFGRPPGSGSGLNAAGVPEPASFALVLVALATLAAAGCKHR